MVCGFKWLPLSVFLADWLTPY